MTGVIILVAVAGKFLGSFIAAKYVGQSWKDSLIIGALMNTRGLVELVVLNIGYDLGVLSPEIFAMLVIMALATTFMTGPALNIINWLFRSMEEDVSEELRSKSKFKILITFGNPEHGRSLLKLAHRFIKNYQDNAQLTAMHLSHGEHHLFDTSEYEEESFMPIIEEADELGQELTTLFKVSSDIDADIVEIANKGDYDLLLIGIRQSIFEGSLLGKILGFTTRFFNPESLLKQLTGKENLFEDSPFDERTKSIINRSKISVGVFINKKFGTADNILIPIISEKDFFLIEYARRLIINSDAQVVIWDICKNINKHSEIKENIRLVEQKVPNHISILNDDVLAKDFLKTKDLMILSMESWKTLIDSKSLWLSNIPSTLILKNR